jgi:hypothetical protein
MISEREPLLVPGWARALALSVLSLAMATWMWWPAILAYPGTATLDGRYFHHQIAISKAAVLRYHEMPLWNAFDCRGIPMWDHPENITGSPIFWLTLPLNTTTTVIVWHIVHCAVGFLGMWLLARHEFKLSRTATFIAASFWAFAAGHTTQYAGAHEALISFYDAPLLLLLWRRAEREWSAAVGCGLVLAWMVYDGATYPLPYTIVMLGLETLCRVWPPKRGMRVAAAAAVVGLVAFSVGAARLLPLMEQLASHKRVMEDDIDKITLPMLRDMYTMRSTSYLSRYHNQQYVLGEYLTYIGWLGVALAILGMVATAAEMTWMAALALLVMLLMMGHWAKFAPWTLLHEHVFPFKSMRVSARFRLLLMMPISLWVALATERVPALVKRMNPQWGSAVRVLLVGLALLCAGDVAGLGQDLIVPRFSGAPEQRVHASTRFYYGGPGLTGDAIDQPRQNRAYLWCRAAWTWYSDAPLWEGDVPQARPIDDGAVVEVANRTHNTFELDVDVKRPSRVLLNSAYDRGWQSDVGTTVENAHQLAIDLPPGRYKVHVKYWPRKMTTGIVITVLGVVGSLLVLMRADVAELLEKLRTRRART